MRMREYLTRPNPGSKVFTFHKQGILIDRAMQTSYPDIYAASDVAQGIDFSTGQYSVQAIQPTAAEHGQSQPAIWRVLKAPYIAVAST